MPHSSPVLLLTALATTACTPAAFTRLQYGATLPVAGAPRHVGANDAGFQFGAISRGPGVSAGGVLDLRVRLPGLPAEVLGGSIGPAFVGALTPRERTRPFLVSSVGVALLGTTGLHGEADQSFDILSPRADLSVGFPTVGGLTVAIGLSFDWLHRIDGDDVGLVGLTLSVGVMDPRLSPQHGKIGRLFQLSSR